MLETIFTCSIIMVFYAYFGYPLSLILFGLFSKKTVRKQSFFPEVSFIITAYNEEKRIREKIENTLTLNYPKEKLQIIVTSDGSTDMTNSIVKSYEERGVLLNALERRVGKESAQREALKVAKGEIIVFSDVATMLKQDSLMEIISNFADPEVGCVSSEDRVIYAEGKPASEGMYVKYEMWLRRLESNVNSLVGLSGSFFAARKEVCLDFSGEMQSDFRTVLNSIKLGLRAVSDPLAIGYYWDVANDRHEFNRKVRTVLRGITVFFHHLEFLNFFRYGFFSYQYLCHKLLRWLVPLFLIIFFISNIFLIPESPLFIIIFTLQIVFYGSAILGLALKGIAQKLIIKIATYFMIVNLSILVAWLRYLKGERVIMWIPSQR